MSQVSQGSSRVGVFLISTLYMNSSIRCGVWGGGYAHKLLRLSPTFSMNSIWRDSCLLMPEQLPNFILFQRIQMSYMTPIEGGENIVNISLSFGRTKGMVQKNIYPPQGYIYICPRVHLILLIFPTYGLRNLGFKNTNKDGPLLNPENFYKKVNIWKVNIWKSQYLVSQYLKVQKKSLQI